MRGLIVDNFAGGGGASTGIEMAIGHSVDVAINHDPAAIAMHRASCSMRRDSHRTTSSTTTRTAIRTRNANRQPNAETL